MGSLGGWVGVRGMDVWAGLIRGPQQAETDPSFTLSMRGRPTISPRTLRASLVNSLVAANSGARTEGQTVQQLIKGGWSPSSARPQTAACQPSPPCQQGTLQKHCCLAAIAWHGEPAAHLHFLLSSAAVNLTAAGRRKR